MKIILKELEHTTIDKFAENNGLVMVVHERERKHWRNGQSDKYYASFENVEIVDGPILISTHGNGATPEDAISNYAKIISGKNLVVNAFGGFRRNEIKAPELNEQC